MLVRIEWISFNWRTNKSFFFLTIPNCLIRRKLLECFSVIYLFKKKRLTNVHESSIYLNEQKKYEKNRKKEEINESTKFGFVNIYSHTHTKTISDASKRRVTLPYLHSAIRHTYSYHILNVFFYSILSVLLYASLYCIVSSSRIYRTEIAITVYSCL